MVRDELLLLRQWDSGRGAASRAVADAAESLPMPALHQALLCTFHTAIADPGAPADIAPRESIELRVMALFAPDAPGGPL